MRGQCHALSGPSEPHTPLRCGPHTPHEDGRERLLLEIKHAVFSHTLLPCSLPFTSNGKQKDGWMQEGRVYVRA